MELELLDLIILFLFVSQCFVYGNVVLLFIEERFINVSRWIFALLGLAPVIGVFFHQWQLMEINLSRSILSLAFIVAGVFLLYKGKANIKLTLIFVITLFLTVGEFLNLFFLTEVIQIVTIESITAEKEDFIIAQLMFALILMIFYVLITIFSKRVKVAYAEIKLFVPFVISQLILIVVLFLTTVNISQKISFFSVVGMIISSAIADIYLYRAIVKIQEKRETDERAKFFEKQLDIQIENYKELGEFNSKLKTLSHDVGNKLQVINSLLVKQNYEEAELFSGKLEEEIRALNEINYCNHKIINALIYSKAKEAKAKGIYFDVTVAIEDNLKIEKMDICSVFSNLIDNALEACDVLREQSPDRAAEIFLEAKRRGEYIIVKCTNSYDGVVNRDKKDQFLSTKGNERGRGLSILKNVAEKYKGSYEISYDLLNFKVSIVMKDTI